MRIRRFALIGLFAVLAAFALRGTTPSANAAETVVLPYAAASESYYKLDTANGRISVKVHGEYQNQTQKDLLSLPIYLMPGAENFTATSEGSTLEATIDPGSEANAVAGSAILKLPRALKPKTRIVLDATYEIGPRTGGKMMTLEAGLIETPFIGQGPGSFVLVDVPETGDTYLDPGCLRASDQPKDVKAGGLVRWVCGEVTLIAINGDDPDVVSKCAALDDKCRQRVDVAVFSAYVMSITDLSRSAKLEGDVTMPSGKNVHMELKYFKRDAAWADKQFAIAKLAFPRLEQVFGFSYPLDTITMRESHHLENIGAAGIAFNGGGEVLLAQDSGGVDEEVTVHELAHQWSTYKHFQSSFMVEGLAEYGMRVLAPELGITPRDWAWQAFGVNQPLSTWSNGLSGLITQYFYGRAGSFWFAYEAAIGGRENMNLVLGRLDDEMSLWPVDAGWFMDQGEWVSGKNLDSLFMEWVFNPITAKTLISERRTAHDSVDALQSRAQTLGLSGMPSDIYDNLLAWVFDPVADQVVKANKVLDSYTEVIALSEQAGLGRPDGVGQSWGKKRIADTQVVVENQRQAINTILSSTEAIKEKPQDSPSWGMIAQAREKYSAGDFPGAKSFAANAVTSAYNEVAAGKMIEIAKKKQADFSPGFFGRIGLMFTNPDADLKKAEEAQASGDGTAALKLARGAYDTWDGASERGIQRLAMVAGLMCGLTFVVWFLLRRLEGPGSFKKVGQGHVLEVDPQRRSSWKDWENQK
ncbi:MAG: hypothetical protein ABI577_00485 [bacterium]